MYHISENGTSRLVKGSSTSSPRDDFEVHLSTLTADLDGVWQLMEGGVFSTAVGYFKSLTDVTVWLRANIPSYAPRFEHFIDLDIILAGIRQTGVSSEEVWKKQVHSEKVNCSANKSVVVTSFQRTSPEDWGSSNENNNFSNMTTFKQWSYGDGQRGIIPSNKKGIIRY